MYIVSKALLTWFNGMPNYIYFPITKSKDPLCKVKPRKPSAKVCLCNCLAPHKSDMCCLMTAWSRHNIAATTRTENRCTSTRINTQIYALDTPAFTCNDTEEHNKNRSVCVLPSWTERIRHQ